MRSRLTVFALIAALLVAFAVPALAAPAKTTPKVQSLSTRALSKARLALLTARSAKSQSRTAVRTAGAAVNTANEAKGTAAAVQAALDSTRIKSSLAPGAVGTEEEKFVQLPGGPAVTVAVPAPGLIEVWAQVTVVEEGAVALFEDGQKMAGQGESCGAGFDTALISVKFAGPEPTTIATPGAPGFVGCGVLGPPGSVLFQTSPGTHTYELRYEACGCGPGEADFSNRLLRVAPRL